MSSDLIFNLIGGLGLFFFGMRTMSDGLKKVAGSKLKDFLHAVTKHRVYGILVGTAITVLIQSSSATTVMVVGFVNAGMLGLKQAIAVIMGANIGTTFTAWLVSAMAVFKISQYALPAIGIGFAITALTKTRKNQSWGQVLLGFGVLFVGLSFMKDAFAPLKGSPALTEIFATFSANPLLGVLAGVVFTVILQSSSATIAIVQVLALNGVITFDAAVPIILGDNIGTTITAQLAAMGTNLNARRAAMSHTLFNVLGTAYMLIFVQLGIFAHLIDVIVPGTMTVNNSPFYIAVAHSTFNVINTLVFLPFIGFLEKASIWLVPQKEEEIDFSTQYLEKHLLDTPSVALEQVHKEVIYMLGVAHKAVRLAVECFLQKDTKNIQKVYDYETATDNLQSEITQYLVELSQQTLLLEQSEELPVLIHNVNDLERIGDRSQNIAELAKRRVEDNLPFSEEALMGIQSMWQIIDQMFINVDSALKQNSLEMAEKVLTLEKEINGIHDRLKLDHIDRLNKGTCQLNSGFIFVEITDNLEKVADRITNLAESVLGNMRWELQHEKRS